MGNQDFNPDEGNGIIHPVYLSPLAMHKLEQSVQFKDPGLEDAQEGNMECSKGATVSCMDSGKQEKFVDAQGIITVRELQVPEKISCFAGCAR